MQGSFTPKAKKIWESISSDHKKQILSSLWCAHCNAMTTIAGFHGKTESGLLLLRGRCDRCSGKVVKVIGTQKLRSLFYKMLAKKKMKAILKETMI